MPIRIRYQDNKYQSTQVVEHKGIIIAVFAVSKACYMDQKPVICIKCEVELVWNGKTSEVTNIVLPFQVIEQVDEPRKSKPLMDANTRESNKILSSIPVHSRLSLGDN